MLYLSSGRLCNAFSLLFTYVCLDVSSPDIEGGCHTENPSQAVNHDIAAVMLLLHAEVTLQMCHIQATVTVHGGRKHMTLLFMVNQQQNCTDKILHSPQAS